MAANQEKQQKLNGEDQEKFKQSCNENPYEISNYCRDLSKKINELSNLKALVIHLKKAKIEKTFAQLTSTLKPLPPKTYRNKYPYCPWQEKEAIYQDLLNATE